jgi:precorrin-6B C5,15-methyltransferase / cobalt-precorrin-6B C5,C15-methyltransferase
MLNMDQTPWLTIVGMGEDGPDGLSRASRDALAAAELVAGPARHLALVQPDCETLVWPVPFSDGIAALLAHRGRRVVMLVSGDPFWFGAGTSVTKHLDRAEWQAIPAPSTFGWAASSLGWPLETTLTLGLHAAPLSRLRPHLAMGTRALVLLRDEAAVGELAGYLRSLGWGDSTLHVLERLGGPNTRHRTTTATDYALTDVAHPVAVGLQVAGHGTPIPRGYGLSDTFFDHDGQITKRPVRALTLSALAPVAGESLWDIGAGSGSVSIEWLLAHPTTQATAFEADPTRAARARANALALGVDRLHVIEGRAPEVLAGPPPDAVFIGGGLSDALLTHLWDILPAGVRVVANAVTLESEATLAHWHTRAGGSILRVELAEATPLGRLRGWRAAYPIVQWVGRR